MKVSKIFGCVLGLHLCLIAVLIVQPGCQSTQPPTQTYTQTRTTSAAPANPATATSGEGIRSSVRGATRSNMEMYPAVRDGETAGLDPAFNAGFEDEQFAPRSDFREFDAVEPLEPLSAAPTLPVAGPSFETYTVKRGDSLWAISRRYSVPLSELLEVNGLEKDAVLRTGQQLQIPVEGGSATVSTVTPDAYQPSGFNQSTQDYTVQRGDTLSGLAKRFDTTVAAIKAANGKTSDVIRLGESLVIPVGDNATATTSAGSTTRVTSPSVSASTGSASSSATGIHVVQQGEFPGTIARRYGMTTSELLAINGITDPRKLRVGTRLKVDSTGSAANVDSRIETVGSTGSAPASQPAPAPTVVPPAEPVEIRVIEADPLVESEFQAIAEEEDPFNDAVEIPVIRLEE